jgi:hypothetical protein
MSSIEERVKAVVAEQLDTTGDIHVLRQVLPKQAIGVFV